MEDRFDTMVQQDADELFQILGKRFKAEEIERAQAAFELAKAAHAPQRRKTGEPYIIHPIAVARIVAESLELGVNPVIAAFLHDVVEDTDYNIDYIRDHFGEDVAFLVATVTKQKKKTYDHSKQVDNYRQMLSSVKYDIRALLIKLADRLHNMRTLESMRTDKQLKIAGETIYFYAPLANRLGLYHVKSELEDLSFRYRSPREYHQIEDLLEAEISQEKENLGAFTAKINELLEKNDISARLEVRYRTPYSIWRKMQAAGCDFAHVDGNHYLRIIFPKGEETEKKTSLRIYSALSDFFKEKPGSLANYINSPKENGYQSFHIKLLSERGTWEEVHISSERMVRNSRLGCAAERSETNVQKWLDKFNTLLKDMAENSDEMDFMTGVTSAFYYDDIMVYTPKGKVIILPKDATALDFAFEIHKQVGIHAVYARINGKLSSVRTVLHRGDCVEIFTDEKSLPDADWINHVMTYKAIKGLRAQLALAPAIQYHRGKYCHPLPGDEVIGFKDVNGVITLHKRNCPDAIRLASQQGDSIVAVNFEEDPSILYPVRVRIRGVDRYHLLSDLVECITEKLGLCITCLHTQTVDRIAECSIDFSLHSARELESAMLMLKQIEGVDEVTRIDIE